MVFPDGTHALDDVSSPSRRASSSRSSVRPGAASRRCCGSHRASRRTRRAPATSTATRIGYVFQDATLLPWRTVQRNVELQRRAARHAARPSASAKAAEAIKLVNLVGHEEQVPEAALGRHEDAVLARPVAGAQPEGVPVRRAVRRPRRDHPRAPQRRAARACSSVEQFAGLFITHSISEAVFLSHPGARDVGPPGRIIDDYHGAVRLSRVHHELRYEPEFARSRARVSARPARTRTREHDRRSPCRRRRRPTAMRPQLRRSADRARDRQARSGLATSLPPLILFWHRASGSGTSSRTAS